MVPLLKFYFHEDIRIAAVQSLPELLRSTVLAVEGRLTADTKMPAQLLDFVWQPLVEALHKVPPPPLLWAASTNYSSAPFKAARWCAETQIGRPLHLELSGNVKFLAAASLREGIASLCGTGGIGSVESRKVGIAETFVG